ncbi:hypothetical protein JHZ66_20780 [Pseudomonas cannabina pv. alisalensis]|uniref:Uncharacterized protein n=2 Tax=Pseudomonas cannabina TaxID=86840 RepID=A0ABS1XI86_PSEC1|nr:hypothetical protein [Pseudomonas cannabina pv. alisalensis]
MELHASFAFLDAPSSLARWGLWSTYFTKAMLEATFTDSKGIALEGGVLDFTLEFPVKEDKIEKRQISDSAGKIMHLIEFKGCEGGNYADDFVHYSNGKSTWSTRYEVGKYWAENVLLKDLADKPHEYWFGHICKRWLSNWSRD